MSQFNIYELLKTVTQFYSLLSYMHFLWGELKLLVESNKNAYDYVKSKRVFLCFVFKKLLE